MKYPAIEETNLPQNARIAAPTSFAHTDAALEEPALHLMIDLHRTQAVTISLEARIDDAKAQMLRMGVRMLFVVDECRIAGLVTSTDLLGEKPMRVAMRKDIAHADIRVADLMTPRNELEVLDLRDVRHARIGNLVATLNQSGRQHALVVDYHSEEVPEICGIFSAAQISRKLGIEMTGTKVARSFAEIEQRFIHG